MRRILVLLALVITAYGQPKIDQSEWTKPFPPHRIVGPVYYVGTADLACFLITSPDGSHSDEYRARRLHRADSEEHRVPRIQARPI